MDGSKVVPTEARDNTQDPHHRQEQDAAQVLHGVQAQEPGQDSHDGQAQDGVQLQDGVPVQEQVLVTADEWFAGGERRWYDPAAALLLREDEASGRTDLLKVFGRVTRVSADGSRRSEVELDPDGGSDEVWLTMLPGFPEGSYGWAQVDRLLPVGLGPRLYVEPVGQGDSDKPRGYAYSTVERADLVAAWWQELGVRRTVVVTFDYTSLALLELLRRQLERPGEGTTITAAFMVNGGLYPDRHTHPLRGTPLLRSPLGALVARRSQQSAVAFGQGFKQAQMYSRGYQVTEAELVETWSALVRRDGARFLHEGAGFVKEHRRNGARWDLAAIARALDGSVSLTVGGSTEDPYEHRQVAASGTRVPEAEIVTFPGGHLITTEQPAMFAAVISRIARRHGVLEQ
ncbi:alpha/beta hydrolase [Kribbella sp. NPDC026611]|uniref:alpha/beta fold hydrolase n=1 Tax=Kribbella sp. NPDC026611 TaxID=3154911 RepID=UPI0033E9435A